MNHPLGVPMKEFVTLYEKAMVIHKRLNGRRLMR
jgi:hypothetical protein